MVRIVAALRVILTAISVRLSTIFILAATGSQCKTELRWWVPVEVVAHR